jgi:hypothetical protein
MGLFGDMMCTLSTDVHSSHRPNHKTGPETPPVPSFDGVGRLYVERNLNGKDESDNNIGSERQLCNHCGTTQRHQGLRRPRTDQIWIGEDTSQLSSGAAHDVERRERRPPIAPFQYGTDQAHAQSIEQHVWRMNMKELGRDETPPLTRMNEGTIRSAK